MQQPRNSYSFDSKPLQVGLPPGKPLDDWNVIKKWRPDVSSQIMFSRSQQPFQRGGEKRETRENLYCSALAREFPEVYTRKVWILLILFFSIPHWSL